HRVDLGPRLALRVVRLGKEVAAGDGVAGRVAAARRDPQELAAEVVRVGRRLAGVVERAGALGERRVAARGLGVRVDVVADADQQVALQVEVERAARVAGLVRLAAGGDVDDLALRRRVDRGVRVDGEAGDL